MYVHVNNKNSPESYKRETMGSESQIHFHDMITDELQVLPLWCVLSVGWFLWTIPKRSIKDEESKSWDVFADIGILSQKYLEKK